MSCTTLNLPVAATTTRQLMRAASDPDAFYKLYESIETSFPGKEAAEQARQDVLAGKGEELERQRDFRLASMLQVGNDVAEVLCNGCQVLPVATACIRALESPHSAGSSCFLVVREWHPACVKTTEQRPARPMLQTDLYQWRGCFGRIVKGACLTQSGNVRSPKNGVESIS
jgi:hypothetical protein